MSFTYTSTVTGKDFIDNENNSHDVVIWYVVSWTLNIRITDSLSRSKSYCPFCAQTKKLFASEFPNADVAIHELDQMNNGALVQRTLMQMTGQRTVPNVFVKGQHVGGNDDTEAAFRSGKLQSMLAWAVYVYCISDQKR